jgi:hypothetical protein
VRVTSDRQTLILAGEMPPRRNGIALDRFASDAVAGDTDDTVSGGQNSRRVTIISARVDAIVTQGQYTPSQKAPLVDSTATVNDLIVSAGGTQLPTIANSASSLPALPPKLHQAYVVSNRGSSSNAASAYARTRDLSDRTPLIDTYA